MEADSSMMTAYLMAIATALIILYYLTAKDDGYPPGPYAFPLVGNLPQMVMAGSMMNFMGRNRQMYGNAFTFVLGGNKRVVVSGYEVMRELLVKNADFTSNRSTKSMSPSLQEYVNAGTPGILWAPYPHWKTIRSFSINTLREEGMGKATMEPQILEEVEQYISFYIEPHLGQPISISKSLMQATYNLISMVLLGTRFEYDDEAHVKVVEAIYQVIHLTMKAGMIASLPLGRLFNGALCERERHMRTFVVWPMIQKYIDEHKESLNEGNPRDIIDRYLINSKSSQDKDIDTFSEANAKVYCYHMYLAGTDTTTAAIQWAILFMCLHPEDQGKVQAEIDQQIGSGRVATCKDRVRMHYTDAVLYETLRKANIASFSLPHTLEKAVAVDQVEIPAGADLMLNMASALHDETVFEEPEKFKPERYLTGDIALKKQRTIPFGIGRRACLGERLARMEMFLFFVTLLQRYNMCIPDGETATDTPVESIACKPKPFNVVFTAR